MLIRIKSIRVWGFHGVYDFEKEKGGQFEIDIEGECVEPTDAESDLLNERVDYEALSKRTTEIFLEKRFLLIEPVAARIARILLEETPLLRTITVSLRKLAPPMDTEIAYAEIVVQREK